MYFVFSLNINVGDIYMLWAQHKIALELQPIPDHSTQAASSHFELTGRI
jgi:hypothetical protein